MAVDPRIVRDVEEFQRRHGRRPDPGELLQFYVEEEDRWKKDHDLETLLFCPHMQVVYDQNLFVIRLTHISPPPESTRVQMSVDLRVWRDERSLSPREIRNRLREIFRFKSRCEEISSDEIEGELGSVS